MKRIESGRGNYLQKSRRNVYLSGKCWEMLHEMGVEIGLNHSNTIEICVRMAYPKVLGKNAKSNVDLINERFDL